MTYEVSLVRYFWNLGHQQAAQGHYFGLHSLQHRDQGRNRYPVKRHGKLKRHRDWFSSNIFKAWSTGFSKYFLIAANSLVWDVFDDQIKLSCPSPEHLSQHQAKRASWEAGCPLVKLTRRHRWQKTLSLQGAASTSFFRSNLSVTCSEKICFSARATKSSARWRHHTLEDHRRSDNVFNWGIMRQLSHQALWLDTSCSSSLQKIRLSMIFAPCPYLIACNFPKQPW